MTEPSVVVSKQGKLLDHLKAPSCDVHLCIVCEHPVKQHARLLPCLHSFCRLCASQMQGCALCQSAVDSVELIKPDAQTHISALTLQCYDSAFPPTILKGISHSMFMKAAFEPALVSFLHSLAVAGPDVNVDNLRAIPDWTTRCTFWL